MSRYLRDVSRHFLAVALFAPTVVLATEYTIEEVYDTDPDACSLVEAVEAISTRTDTGGCAAGSGSDVIYLPEGETLQLTAELVLGGEEETIPAQDENDPPETRPINPTLTIRVVKEGPFDDDDKVNATLQAADGARIISIKPGARLIVQEVDLVGGATLGVSDNGGLIHAEGQVTLSGLRLTNGKADLAGGTIWLGQGAPLLSLTDVLVEDNSASDGGALAAGPDFEGAVQISRSVFANNTADRGSAIFFASAQPTQDSSARASISNSTFYNHATPGSAVIHVADVSSLLVNNVTIAGNGLPGFYFDSAIHDRATIGIRNSVLVGNQGGSCTPSGFETASSASWSFAYVLSEGSCPLDHDAWVRDPNDPSLVVQNGSANADLTVLRGLVDAADSTQQITSMNTLVEAECAAVSGENYCLPLCMRPESRERGYETTAGCMADGGTLAYMPTFRSTLPVAFNAGSPDGSTEFACQSTDQRTISRPENCDAGSIELVVAQGLPDEFDAIIGVETEMDVLQDALGDADIDPACSVANLGLSVRVSPLKGTAWPEIRNGRPVIIYRSDPATHGVDRFEYSMAAQCIDGPVATLTSGNEIVGQVNVVVQPASGIKSESAGSAGVLSLVILALFGVGRRAHWKLYTIPFLVGLPLSAGAAEIWVNSVADAWPAVVGDGDCTLREAYNTAINNSPNPSPDCNSGSRGADIIRFRDSASGVICLRAPLNNVLASGDSPGGVEIIGLGAYTGTVDELYTVIDGGRDTNAECVGGNGSQLIIAGSSLTVRNATLRNGTATNHGGAIVALGLLTLDGVVVTDNQANGSGGAIYLGYTGELRRNVRIMNSEFSNNVSQGHGGVLSMLGQEQEYSMLIERSAFLANTSGGTGGALDINLAKGSVAIINSTFAENTATGTDEEFGTLADAIDVAGVAASSAARLSVINSTFIDHPARAIDMRAGANVDSDSSGVLSDGDLLIPVSISNSVWLNSGDCSSSGTGQFYQRGYNVFAPHDATCTAFSGEQYNDGSPTNEDGVPAATLAEVFPARTVFERTDDDVTAPHYPIDDAQAPGHAGLAAVLNAGRDSDLYAGDNNPLHCRLADVRSYSRTAGGVCDRGAHELPMVTAVDDEGTNQGRRDRDVVVNVLANDNPGDATEDELKTAELCLTENPADTCTAPVENLTLDAGSVRAVLKENPDFVCGTTGADIEHPDECVVRYEPPALTCTEVNEYSDTFSYRFRTDPGGAWSTPGSVEVNVSNVKPWAEEVVVTSSPGEVVVLPLQIEDPDGDASQVSNIGLVSKPVNARYDVVDGEPVYLGTGIVVDVQAGIVTYYPHNAFSPFSETFTLSFEDECGGQGSATFRIKYPNSDASGDLSGGGGSVGWWPLLGLVVLGLRRRH